MTRNCFVRVIDDHYGSLCRANLLRQAAESRRMQQLEQELALQHKGSLPLLSIRAQAAGYGDEWEAYVDALLVGPRAREELVTRNMGLVQYCVNAILKSKKNNRLNSLSRDDLVQRVRLVICNP